MSDSLRPSGLYSPWNSPGQNTGLGSLSLLQEIFPTEGSNPGLSHCRQILQQLRHKRNPKILEWVACPFSSGSSQPKNQTRVSCIAGGFFATWAIREAQYLDNICIFLNVIAIIAMTYISNYLVIANYLVIFLNHTETKQETREKNLCTYDV